MADLSIRDLADKVDDLSRLVARQSGALGQIADPRRRPGSDVALLVDLHALRGDALAAASTTRSGKERGAFEAIATGLERLLAGRGGVLVVPRAGHPFSAATMEATEEVACSDASLDRTVATLLAPGLEADGRTVRPARVAVHRYVAQPVATDPAPEDTPEPQPEDTPEPPAPERNGHGPVTNGRKVSRARRPAAASAEPEPGPGAERKARPARRAKQPSPTQPEPESAASDPETRAPAKRAARKPPARNPGSA
ncbi:hypothetical protein GCM10009609_25760 [Pseudonocardia aurantiaca]|uniref:Molecular chaperone GrpE n=1 Tax=Pseudonocardia aurantiaca TaxID=75290 RepID=A0ABW4FVY4_9PSEU